MFSVNYFLNIAWDDQSHFSLCMYMCYVLKLRLCVYTVDSRIIGTRSKIGEKKVAYNNQHG